MANGTLSLSHNVDYAKKDGGFFVFVPLSFREVKPVELGLWQDCRDHVDRVFRLIGILDDAGASYGLTLHYVHNSGVDRYLELSRFRNVADELRVSVLNPSGEIKDCVYFRPWEIHSTRLWNFINSFLRGYFSHCGFRLSNCVFSSNKEDFRTTWKR